MKIKLVNFIVPAIWVGILLANIQQFFFWDTIQLASKHAHFYFENNFSQFFLPEEINSGHPPFFGMLLAALWKIFGKHLIIGHAFMALVTLGSLYRAHQLGKYFLDDNRAFLFPLILFCNPIFLGHSVLVSPDNVLLFLLISAIHFLINSRRDGFAIVCLLLAMLSMRGMMVVLALFIANVLFYRLEKRRITFKLFSKYALAGLFSATFLLAHYFHTRWIGFHDESPWHESFQLVNISGYLYNLGLIVWRLIDFGNIFILLPIPVLIWKLKDKLRDERFTLLFSLLIGFAIVLVLPLAAFQYLTGHRYFMPIYLVLSFAFIKLIFDLKYLKILSIVLLLLFLGNWWIYPRSISQGWDVSLSHLPFYQLTEEMLDYVEMEQIDAGKIGTQFPLKSESKYLYLSNEFPSFKEGVIGEDQFILYSRVMNDFKEEEYAILKQEYTLVKSLVKGNIDLELYEKSK